MARSRKQTIRGACGKVFRAIRWMIRASGRALRGAFRLSRVTLRFTKTLCKLLLKFLPPGLEVFLHGGFGERYALRLGGSLALFWLYRKCALMVASIAGSEAERAFLDIHGIGLLVAAVVHLFAMCVRRFRQIGELHSRSSGTPWPIWEQLALPEWFTVGFIEPAIGFAVALVIRPHASALALWLEASSVALFVKTHLSRFSHRRNLLDALDARMEGRQLSNRIQERLSPRGQAANTFFVAEPEDEK
jgi:hypothetical protein